MNKEFDALLCDDIREERSGKIILVGLYTGTLTVSKPQEVAVTAFMRAFGLNPGKHQLSVRVKLGDELILEGNAGVNVTEADQYSCFPLPHFFFDASSRSELVIEAKKEADLNWQVAAQIPIAVAASGAE